jgi:DNA-binding LytR/AlgR family response regulator
MDKFNIAICDASTADVKLLLSTVQKTCKEEFFPANIETFYTGDALLNQLDAGRYYDIVFLEIEISSGISGIEVGRLIREQYHHDETIIYFVSAHTQYLGELFSVHPYDFIMKPIHNHKHDIRYKLLPAFDKIKRQADLYKFTYNRSHYVLNKKKILYLESSGRNVDINYIDNSEYKALSFRGALKAEKDKFPPPDFVIPHASFIVNLHHVTKFQKSQLEMKNGKRIKITYTQSKQAKAIIYHFLERIK